LRIGLVTQDAKLRAKVTELATEAKITLVLCDTAKDAQTLMSAPDLAVRVLDYAAKKLLPESLLRAHAFLGGKPDDIVVVVAPSGEMESERRHAFGRKQVDLVLAEIRRAVPEEKARDAADSILGVSAPIIRVREQIRHIARFRDVPVMILGETGTGKELVADAVHKLGAPEEALVAVNCAAIPSELVESELFGHEAGAYTGARNARVGLLEAAGLGTIFLDEIGEMPIVLQPKLLRALEQRKFRRVGASADTTFRARVVSATNRSLSGASLRSDLRYRLAGFTIVLPPLRARPGDVELLAQSFLTDFGDRHKLSPIWFTSEALAILRQHNWPGNVRELRGVVQHAAIVANARAVDDEAVMQALTQSFEETSPGNGSDQRSPLTEPSDGSLRGRERQLVVDAWQRSGGNVSQTAKILGIARATLRERLKKYGIR
jgi:two-component system NtrC family response regulator